MKTSLTVLKKRSRFFPALFGAAASLLLISSPAQAVPYVLTLQQVGADVVATGAGSIDLTGLTWGGGFGLSPLIQPTPVAIQTGPSGSSEFQYNGTISGPTSVGPGAVNIAASSGFGNYVGIAVASPGNPGKVWVNFNYANDTPLSSSATWSGMTFSDLGVTPGTYEWTWGTGPDQSFTLEIGVPAPDSGSTFGLLFLGLIALFGAARFRSSQLT